MAIKSATFVLSAPDIKHCPDSSLTEICFAGRSNVGKSSLINALTNQKKLAKTSNTPGKTRALNFFIIDDIWHLVDLPGYGYAKVSKKEQAKWKMALEEYLLNREQLGLVCVLVDARHKPQDSDLDFMYWLGTNQIPFMAILTKADKISKNNQQAAIATLKKALIAMNIEVPVQLTSSEKRTGLEEVHAIIESFI